MARRKRKQNSQIPIDQSFNPFHVEWSTTQKLAWAAYQKHDLLFLLGPAGTGKTHSAVAFAIHDILNKEVPCDNIVITRPVVESGESLGFLPGDLYEKLNPYMMPIYDCIDSICGGTQKDKILSNLEVCPIAYMRGRSFNNSIFIFDEAQNATKQQLKLAITRLGKNSKMIITGDPDQSDLPISGGLEDVVGRVSTLTGIGVIRFKENSVVRHPLVAKILKRI